MYKTIAAINGYSILLSTNSFEEAKLFEVEVFVAVGRVVVGGELTGSVGRLGVGEAGVYFYK